MLIAIRGGQNNLKIYWSESIVECSKKYPRKVEQYKKTDAFT